MSPKLKSAAYPILVLVLAVQFWQIYSLGAKLKQLEPSSQEAFDSNLEDSVVEADVSPELFVLVEALAKAEEYELRLQAHDSALEAFSKDPLWTQLGLQVFPYRVLGQAFSFQVKTAEGVEVLKLALDEEALFQGSHYFAPFVFEDASNAEAVFTAVKSFLSQELPTMLIQIQKVNAVRATLQNDILKDVPLQNWMQASALRFGDEETDAGIYRRTLFNADQAPVAQLLVDKKAASLGLQVGEEFYELPELNAATLLSHLQNSVDARTALQKQIDASKQEIDSLLQDAGFVSTLERLNLSMVPGLQDVGRIEYVVQNKEGKTLGIIFIDPVDGILKLERAGVSQTLSLAIESLENHSKKKTLHFLPTFRLNLA